MSVYDIGVSIRFTVGSGESREAHLNTSIAAALSGSDVHGTQPSRTIGKCVVKGKEELQRTVFMPVVSNG